VRLLVQARRGHMPQHKENQRRQKQPCPASDTVEPLFKMRECFAGLRRARRLLNGGCVRFGVSIVAFALRHTGVVSTPKTLLNRLAKGQQAIKVIVHCKVEVFKQGVRIANQTGRMQPHSLMIEVESSAIKGKFEP
jgi:hypothetical protein